MFIRGRGQGSFRPKADIEDGRLLGRRAGAHGSPIEDARVVAYPRNAHLGTASVDPVIFTSGGMAQAAPTSAKVSIPGLVTAMICNSSLRSRAGRSTGRHNNSFRPNPLRGSA